MKAALFVSVLFVCVAAAEEIPPAPSGAARPPSRDAVGRSPAVWTAVPPEPIESSPKQGATRRLEEPAEPSDGLRQLGDVKAIDVREGEAVLRIDGVEQTLRPGKRLKRDVVQSISPRRLVLLRPEGVDPNKGETIIVVELLAGSRSRVRMYSARSGAARPPRTAE